MFIKNAYELRIFIFSINNVKIMLVLYLEMRVENGI